MKSKNLCASLFVLAALLCSCATTVPDTEICATLTGDEGGFCKSTLTDFERTIPEPYWSSCQWDTVSDEVQARKENPLPCLPTMLHMTPKDLGKHLKFIEKVCDRLQDCVGEELDRAKKFLATMESIANEQKLSTHH